MLFHMSKPLLESVVAASDLLVRIFAVLAAISAVAYFISSRQLQKTNKTASETARMESEKGQAELSTAQSRIQRLQSENAQLGSELEAEKQAGLEIQRRFGPRGVLPATRSAMLTLLQPFTGRKLSFGYFTELETAAFAERVLDVLKSAGWKPQVFKLKSMTPIYGIQCGGPNPEDAALNALMAALKLVDGHLTTQDAEAASMLRSAQPQVTDQLWVLVALKRPHLRRTAPENGARPEEKHAAVDRD